MITKFAFENKTNNMISKKRNQSKSNKCCT